MILRKILVPVSGRHAPADPASYDAPALQAALVLGAAHNAHVEMLCVTGDLKVPQGKWMGWVPDYGMTQIAEVMNRDGARRLKNAKKLFDSAVATFEPKAEFTDSPGAGFSIHFHEASGQIGETVGSFGRVSDAIVITSSKTRWESPFRPILEASLRLTASPVFVTAMSPPKTIGTNIALAWNDSVESSRALSGAMGLLKSAEEVTILTCLEDDAKEIDLQKIDNYLRWHGVNAKMQVLKAKRRDSARALITAAIAADCDLIVLGSQIHARVHSLVFGSLTEHVISDPKISALLVP